MKNLILTPLFLQIFTTIIVYIYLFFNRFKAIKRGKIDMNKRLTKE